MKLSELLKKENEWKDIDVEKCYKCGHIIAKCSMQEVKRGNYIGDLANTDKENKYPRETMYYCSICKVGYDYEVWGHMGPSNYYKKVLPYKEINEDGTEIK